MKKEIIQYDDFEKIEIVIGEILSAQTIEGADKLLKLMVAVGEDAPRQILSGIREFYPDEQALVGKKCPFLINLTPRTIRGIESQGMILAVGDAETFSLLAPEKNTPAGTEVH